MFEIISIFDHNIFLFTRCFDFPIYNASVDSSAHFFISSVHRAEFANIALIKFTDGVLLICVSNARSILAAICVTCGAEKLVPQ